jgi:hypothetical protein
MNPAHDPLDRLLRAAAAVHRAEANATPPFGLETRVLAAWRTAGPGEIWSTGLLVRGLLLASVLMALSLWPVLDKPASPTSDYLELADSTLQADQNL